MKIDIPSRCYKSLLIMAAIFMAILFLQKQCHRCPEIPQQKPPAVVTVTITDTVFDTVRIESTVYVPQPNETIYMEAPSVCDCADYHAQRVYGDTLVDDTSMFIAVYDVIQKNSIESRRWSAENRRPMVINTTTTTYTYDTCPEMNRFNMGIGGFVGGNAESFEAGVSVIMTTNKRSAYSVSYDAVNKRVRGTMYWTLR